MKAIRFTLLTSLPCTGPLSKWSWFHSLMLSLCWPSSNCERERDRRAQEGIIKTWFTHLPWNDLCTSARSGKLLQLFYWDTRESVTLHIKWHNSGVLDMPKPYRGHPLPSLWQFLDWIRWSWHFHMSNGQILVILHNLTKRECSWQPSS